MWSKLLLRSMIVILSEAKDPYYHCCWQPIVDLPVVDSLIAHE